MITLITEEQLLDIRFRKKVIKQIQADWNLARKQKKLKAYEIYKDLTKKWVVESISKEFSQDTVEQMVNRASNISVCRKIINKKAKCYAGGVVREIPGDESNTQKLNELAKFLAFDRLMKKADRFSELLKNVEIQVLYTNDAVETDAAGVPKKRLVNRIMLPHQYDPICHAQDSRKPVAFVLSDFQDSGSTIITDLFSDHSGLRDSTQPQTEKKSAATKEADRPSCYIWWSSKFHFTTDDKGNILEGMTPEGMANPIGQLNFVPVHDDQDDSYWCDGGDDLIDGSVLVNVLLTDLFSIMNVQGWGQLVVSGKKVPSKITGGPHKALVFEFDEGDPEPKVQYVSSNPPIQEWRECITMYVALLLSTNGLATSNISTKLEGSSAQVASGVAMMLDNAESIEPVEDKQKMFQDAEKHTWKLNFATQNYLFGQGVAVEEQAKIGEIRTTGFVETKFHQQKAVMTESEKVELQKQRKESGLYEIVELLQIQNPDLSPEEAEKKAEKLLADRMKYAVLYQAGVAGVVNSLNRELNEPAPNASGASDGGQSIT